MSNCVFVIAFSMDSFVVSTASFYSYVLLDTTDKTGILYKSDIGLWSDIDKNNHLINPNFKSNNFRIIDNYQQPLNKTINQSELNDYQLNYLKNFKEIDLKLITLNSVKFDKIFNDGSNMDLINKVIAQHQVEIIISLIPKKFQSSIQLNCSFNKDDKYIYLIGESKNIINAEVSLRVIFDDLNNLYVDSLSLPLSIIPLVGGLNFSNFKSIAKQTGVNLYLPNLQNSESSNPLIYITGLEAQVQLAIKLLLNIKNNKNFKIFYKSIEILKFKKNLLILNKLQELSSICYKYGIYIKLPLLTDSSSIIEFQGLNPELIEFAINDLIELTNDMILTNIQLSKKIDLNLLPKIQFNLTEISLNSDSNIILNIETNSIQTIGFKSNLLNFIKNFELGILPLFKDDSILIKTELELNLNFHEFLSGKKNGKIIKILNSSNGCSKIQFKPFNDYVFTVELFSNSVNDFISSLDNLKMEFPSEFKFFIPESFHRQIIGTGGSLIQSIMRKYNVFVKFTNQLDINSSIQFGNLIRFDNVIIRCPSKNSSNIPLVQQELNSLLSSNEILNTYVKISKNHYKLFNFAKIHEIEKNNQVFIRFPTNEFNESFHIVEILGLDKNSINASKSLINELSNCYEFKISFSVKFNKIFNELNEIYLNKLKIPLKLLYNFEILTIDHNSNLNNIPYHSILLNYLPESEIYLEDVIYHLTQFLRQFEFMILDRSEVLNNDLIINGSAASFQQQKQLFQFNQIQNNSQQLNKFNQMIYPQQQKTALSIFNNNQQNQLTHIYPNIPKAETKKKRNEQTKRFNFKRPL